MDLQLAGKTAIVTGAGRGIGSATVTALLREGASVVGVSRKETDETRDLARDQRFRFLAVDLSEADAGDRVVAFAGDTIDIVVNNVGSAPARPGGFETIDDDQWMQTFTLNLLAAVRVCRAALPRMREGGSIVTVASENSLLPDPLVMDYSAAKAGLLSFSKALSKEVAGRGIRVNSVSPGPVATALWLGGNGVAETVAAATGATPDDVRKGAEASMPTGRFTRPEEVADLVAVLASPRFGNLTGADVVIDGGLRPTI
jgi:NAD(P)-dependent dehydrogenase (short-subunit alcohol dehydrogenase family)